MKMVVLCEKPPDFVLRPYTASCQMACQLSKDKQFHY